MTELFIFGLMAVTGFLVKFTDFWVDDLRRYPGIALLSGAAYGGLIGYLLSADAAVGAVVAGAVLANLFYGKFDAFSHWVAGIVAVFVVLMLGLAEISLILAVVFMLGAAGDEFFKELMRKGRKKVSGVVKVILENRLSMDIVALVVSVLLMNPVYFLAIVSFDVAYHLTSRGMEKIFS